MKKFQISQQIAYFRKKNNLTQEQFASLMGVSNQAVSKWESGACCPDIQLLPTIAECFNVSIDALFITDDYESRSKMMTRYECTGHEEDFSTAIQAYEKVILSGNATTQDYGDYAYLFWSHGTSMIDKAERLYKNALKFGEDSHDEKYYLIHTQVIRLLCWRGRTDECINQYTERLENQADNWWNYYLLSLAYSFSGKQQEAWKLVEKALNQFEGNFYLYTLAGESCRELGEYEKAFEYWKKAYEDNPKQISCLYSAAFLYEALDKTQEAVETWRRIVRWHHDNNFYSNHETDMPLERIERLLGK
ncbi:MAG: helix-turn-helix domain-containing protein [Zhenhengia sp.]|mgnify:CR=1 FL=1|jgi:transcriptional regulator with XRE-family HTH domain|uniref:helix-turn-helix domain-containing protein n=1 Tax=Zhenhengia sp. TaxID=2944208 RepID=UPI002912CF91|nr:helix-turn-helix domain-containing protein [Clostridiales bacterium]MDU6974306.1 helix-turn-helix domain-containing protein [Clostridiales bacterium]